MGKKQVAVSLRKPPPADANAFVSGAAETIPAAPRVPTDLVPSEGAAPSNMNATASATVKPATSGVAPAQTVATRLGDHRELVIYLPSDLAQKLAVRCMEIDRDVSTFIADAVAKTLDTNEPVVTVRARVPAEKVGPLRAILTRVGFELRTRLPFPLPL